MHLFKTKMLLILFFFIIKILFVIIFMLFDYIAENVLAKNLRYLITTNTINRSQYIYNIINFFLFSRN